MAYSKYNRRRFEAEKPVEEGGIYEIEIEATGTKGDGIGKVKGFVVIVPNTKPGQKVKVKIDAVRGKVAFGTVAGETAETKEEAAEEQPAEEATEQPAEEAEPAEEATEQPAEEAEPAEEKQKETKEEAAEEKAGEAQEPTEEKTEAVAEKATGEKPEETAEAPVEEEKAVCQPAEAEEEKPGAKEKKKKKE